MERRQMTHKEALDLVMGKGPWPNDYDGTAKRLKEYIEARGLVLVPKEPCNEMHVAYSHGANPKYLQLSKAGYDAMLAAAPDPFEEGE